jgi:site-specific DNA recombinase
MIREVADRVLGGEPVGAVCRDLNARGYRTTAGNPWDHGALKKLMKRPRLVGLLARHGHHHRPGRLARHPRTGTWEAVLATLDGKATTYGYTTNARRYLLTGIALCGTCLQTVAIRHNTRSETLRGYGCINPDLRAERCTGR